MPAVAESKWLPEGAEKDLRRDIEESKENQPPKPEKKPRAPRKHRLRKCAKRSDGKRDRKVEDSSCEEEKGSGAAGSRGGGIRRWRGT